MLHIQKGATFTTMRLSNLFLSGLLAAFLLPSALYATNFRDASASVLQSNNSGAKAVYFGLLSLQNDSRVQVYYAWINMVSARNAALTAYQKSSAGSAAEVTTNGLQARNNTYKDWLYKHRAAASLYRTYLYGRRADSLAAISNGYLALVFSGRSAYFAGLASEGGLK